MARVRVGVFPPVGRQGGGPEQLHAMLARIGEEGVDHVCVGDHVSFFVGAGSGAEFLNPYVEAGCSAFNVIPCAGDQETAVSAVGELRELLNRSAVGAGASLR